MTYFVTGATGFIGRHLIARLLERKGTIYDEMDMLGFLQVRAWDARREHISQEPKAAFIDQVWPNMK